MIKSLVCTGPYFSDSKDFDTQMKGFSQLTEESRCYSWQNRPFFFSENFTSRQRLRWYAPPGNTFLFLLFCPFRDKTKSWSFRPCGRSEWLYLWRVWGYRLEWGRLRCRVRWLLPLVRVQDWSKYRWEWFKWRFCFRCTCRRRWGLWGFWNCRVFIFSFWWVWWGSTWDRLRLRKRRFNFFMVCHH